MAAETWRSHNQGGNAGKDCRAGCCEQQVRPSLARRLGIDIDGFVTPTRSVEGIVHITLDSTIDFSHPLTAERLFQWHAALFPTGRNEWGHKLYVGNWRDDSGGRTEIVSGAYGYEKVHYVAPPADRLERKTSTFLEWFNETRQPHSLSKPSPGWVVICKGNLNEHRSIGNLLSAQDFQLLRHKVGTAHRRKTTSSTFRIYDRSHRRADAASNARQARQLGRNLARMRF